MSEFSLFEIVQIVRQEVAKSQIGNVKKITGPAGEKGTTGEPGGPGIQGPRGDKGPAGPVGPQGNQGKKGDKGVKGDDGTDGVGVARIEQDLDDSIIMHMTDGNSYVIEMPILDKQGNPTEVHYKAAGGGGGGMVDLSKYVKRPTNTYDGKWLVYREPDGTNQGEWSPATTDLIETNGQLMFRDSKGRFAPTPEELDELTNQLKVNRFLWERIQELDVAAGGVAISDEAPEDPENGMFWFDNSEDVMQLFIWHKDSDAWIPVAPPTTLEGRVSTGEATQQAIIAQIQHSLGEQSAIEGRVKVVEGNQQNISSDVVALEHKVNMLEGVVGEHRYNFTTVNQNVRAGEFNILTAGMELTSTVAEAEYLTLSNTDAGGSTVDTARIVEGDVVRLYGLEGQVVEFKVLDSNGLGFMQVEAITSGLSTLSELPYDFVLLSSYDPAGMATVSYVDARDETKLDKAGTNQLSDETDWKIKQEISGSNKTLLQVQNGQLGVYNLKAPTSGHHATPKSYVDDELASKFSQLQDQLDAPPGQPFKYSSGSSGMGEKCFQYYNSDNRNKIRISTKSLNVDWASQNISGDRFWEGNEGLLFYTIWYYPALGANETRRKWKQRAHGSIDRMDWHVADVVCYIKSHHTKESFTPDATYYITIGGIL